MNYLLANEIKCMVKSDQASYSALKSAARVMQ